MDKIPRPLSLPPSEPPEDIDSEDTDSQDGDDDLVRSYSSSVAST